ncbi:MAG: sensor histidine kinase [Ignavibacteriales bacterium]|nr:sensor histidine kinase [Ignavibacteriales bacterium]
MNLINNAVKYTDPKKSIYISLEHQPDLTIFKFEDEGIGIPGEDFLILYSNHLCEVRTQENIRNGTGITYSKTCS